MDITWTMKRDAFRFFLKNAGGTDGQNAITALFLAKAELAAEAREWVFAWQWDDRAAADGCNIDGCECQEGNVDHDFEYCCLKDAEGNVLASLGAIIDADEDYRRVVEAELASEALWEESKAWGACAHLAMALR